jgi:disulfide bond formation protein DsbB
MVNFQRILNILFIYVLCGVLLGAYTYQYAKSESPCPLCLLQRLGMIGVASALLLNLRFGIKAQHYGLAILSAISGRMVALRQIGLHVCPEFPTFGEPVLGFDLYVWSYMVFTCSIFSAAVLTIIYGYFRKLEYFPTWNRADKTAFWVVAVITLGNAITTLIECGLTTCPG